MNRLEAEFTFVTGFCECLHAGPEEEMRVL